MRKAEIFIDPSRDMNQFIILFYIMLILWAVTLFAYYIKGRTNPKLRTLLYLTPLGITIFGVLTGAILGNSLYSTLLTGYPDHMDWAESNLYIFRVISTILAGAFLTFIVAIFIALTANKKAT